MLLQGDRASGTCHIHSPSLTLMKIARSSISSSVFLRDSRVLQLSGSLVPHSTHIGDLPVTIQQLQINATIDSVLVQTHISFIAATSSPISPLPSSVMALTEHSGGGRVSLVDDSDGTTAWMLRTSSRQESYGSTCLMLCVFRCCYCCCSPPPRRLHAAFYIDSDGDLHPVHIFSNWLHGQGMGAAGSGSGGDGNSSKLRIAEIASFDVFENRGRLFCIAAQPQLFSVIQPPPLSSTVHNVPPPSTPGPFLGVASPPQLILAQKESAM
jgi:hypothetical protein